MVIVLAKPFVGLPCSQSGQFPARKFLIRWSALLSSFSVHLPEAMGPVKSGEVASCIAMESCCPRRVEIRDIQQNATGHHRAEAGPSCCCIFTKCSSDALLFPVPPYCTPNCFLLQCPTAPCVLWRPAAPSNALLLPAVTPFCSLLCRYSAALSPSFAAAVSVVFCVAHICCCRTPHYYAAAVTVVVSPYCLLPLLCWVALCSLCCVFTGEGGRVEPSRHRDSRR